MVDRKTLYSTAILCVTVLFLFADQNLLAPNLTQIARDFGFTDRQRDDLLGGRIALGFFLVGGGVSIIAGFLADTYNRCYLFGCMVLFGETSCLATYWARNYTELFVCRVLTGVSIGGATPIIFSLLADFYPGSSRVTVSSVIGISMSSGIAIGQLVSGVLGPTYGWRLPFLVVALPAQACALLILLTATEPPRGDQEQEVLHMRFMMSQRALQVQAASPTEEGSPVDVRYVDMCFHNVADTYAFG